ncbi:MAG: DUF4783 domain-containing protein [Bacteroidota bacterium]
MKKLFFISFLMIAAHLVQAQNTQVNAALSAGNSALLATYFETTVNITILDNENTYSKQQAEIVIKDFFAKHLVKSFSAIHEGASPEGSKFAVGKLVTSNGTFRTFVLIKQKGTSFVIQEIRFEE